MTGTYADSIPLVAVAFTTGLVGSGHCIGMCGGLVAALSLSGNRRNPFLFHLFYNLGRITTYAAIGAVGGFLASAAFLPAGAGSITRLLLVASDLFIIAAGLAAAGLLSYAGFSALENSSLTTRVTSMASRIVRLPGVFAALPLGLAMGFLPCGFLYAVAITAAQTASPVSGALVMLAFGLGTLPALFLFGSLAEKLRARLRQNLLKGAGLLVAAAGCYNLYWHLDIFFM